MKLPLPPAHMLWEVNLSEPIWEIAFDCQAFLSENLQSITRCLNIVAGHEEDPIQGHFMLAKASPVVRTKIMNGNSDHEGLRRSERTSDAGSLLAMTTPVFVDLLSDFFFHARDLLLHWFGNRLARNFGDRIWHCYSKVVLGYL